MKNKQLLELAAKMANKDAIVTDEERKQALTAIEKALQDDDSPKWWVVLLKVLAYAIGLILAGYGTTAAAMTLI